VPPPRVTFRCAAAARVHPQLLGLFVRASWLSRRISSHRLRLLTRRHLTTGCAVAVADAQASSPSSRLRLSPSSHPVELASSPSSSSLSTSVAIVVVVVFRHAVAMVIVFVDVARCAVAIIVDFAVRCAVAIIVVASSTPSSPVAPSQILLLCEGCKKVTWLNGLIHRVPVSTMITLYVPLVLKENLEKVGNPRHKKSVGNEFVSARLGRVGQKCRLLAVGPTCRRHVGDFPSQGLRL